MLHSHDFNQVNPLAERRTRSVVLLTVVATAQEASADDFRELLAIHPELVHVTVEVNRP